jgi:hypothetical protein
VLPALVGFSVISCHTHYNIQCNALHLGVMQLHRLHMPSDKARPIDQHGCAVKPRNKAKQLCAGMSCFAQKQQTQMCQPTGMAWQAVREPLPGMHDDA